MLTIQFISWGEIARLNPEDKLKRLIDIVKEEKIILMQGKLSSGEKSELISKTMSEINKKFKGIEIEELDLDAHNKAFLEKVKSAIADLLLGGRQGFTIIGPASIIKEIKKDPDKIQLLTDEKKKEK
jgi:hypothetical protein